MVFIILFGCEVLLRERGFVGLVLLVFVDNLWWCLWYWLLVWLWGFGVVMLFCGSGGNVGFFGVLVEGESGGGDWFLCLWYLWV